jgi:DNA-binding winged helix-turn-helix (wHTH) protein/tetratricopeptide (TPR) repeat protein
MDLKTKNLYAFDPFTLDTDRGALFRDGQMVALTQKAFETLRVLVEKSPATVSKEELLQAVWPGTFVEEANLTQHVSTLRKALGETAQERRYIATIPGVGYRFVAPVQRLSSNNLKRDDTAANVATELGAGASVAVVPTPARWHQEARWRWFIGAAALLLVIGVLYRIWVSQRSLVTPPKGSILLADFENSTGEAVFDSALGNALALQLGQSPYLEIIPTERVRETLRFMSRQQNERIVPPLAREVCERLAAPALISGSIARLGSNYVLSLSAEDCREGRTLGREQAQVNGKEGVLPALGDMASHLRQKLGESLTSMSRFSTPIEQVTTSSLDALKAYSLGDEQRAEGNEEEAALFYQHAVELDPQFAMAYAQLGAVYRNLGETEKAATYLTKAYEMRDRLSEREKLYVSTRYFTVVTGETDKATAVYEMWSRIYPNDWMPLNGLAVRYQLVGQYEKAASAASASLKLQPDHYLPYANLAMSNLALNRFDEAERVCLEAEKHRRDSIFTHRVLFDLAFLKRDAAGMERERAWATHADTDLLNPEAEAEAYFGHLHAARDKFNQSWQQSIRKDLKDDAAFTMATAAVTEADFGNFAEAQKLARNALKLGHGIDAVETAAQALASAGNAKETTPLLADLHQRFPHHVPLNLAVIPSVLAENELHTGHPERALKLLEMTRPYDFCEFANLAPPFVRAKAYLQMHDGQHAAAEFQSIIDHSGVDPTNPKHALARLGLARSLVQNHKTDLARKAYQSFLEDWKNADGDISELHRSRTELANLH